MEEHISTASVTIMACCVRHNICINVGDPTEIDPKCDEDSDGVIIPGGQEENSKKIKTFSFTTQPALRTYLNNTYYSQ